MKSTLIISILLVVFSTNAQAQFLKKLGDKVVDTVEKTVENKLDETIENSTSKKKESSTEKSGNTSSTNKKKSSGASISYEPPQATTKVSPSELIRWMDLKPGQKFKEAEDQNIKQVIAVNPYLSPEKPFFEEVLGLHAAADGSLILAGTAGIEADGSEKGIGWWKIAPDGAITSFESRPINSPHPGVYPSEKFTLTTDGALLTIFTEEINTNRVGTKIVRIQANGTQKILVDGLEDPGTPVQDPKGNIWVANKSGTELLRISPDGTRSSNLIGDKNWKNSSLDPQDRISLEHLAWDPIKEELIVGGSFITSKPHDLHSNLWRINSEGKNKRILYAMKNGKSSIGQQIDAIRNITVNTKGQIFLATTIMKDKARRQIARLNENTGKLEVLTGQSFRSGSSDYRPGHEEASYDGPAAHANFREAKNICTTPDGTIFVLDAHQVRRLDKDGVVRTWAY